MPDEETGPPDIARPSVSPDHGRLRLREATLADVPLLERWDEDPAVRPSDVEDWWEWEEELRDPGPWVELLIAELDARPIGFVQLLDAAAEPTHYWGRDLTPGTWAMDIWIGDAADRGRGHGRTMMSLALDRCVGVHGAREVLVDPLLSNLRAHRFYRTCGFEEVGERMLGTDRCLVHRILAPG